MASVARRFLTNTNRALHCGPCPSILRRINPNIYHTRKTSAAVALTSDRYPDVTRKTYSKITQHDLSAFQSIVGSANVLTDDLDTYNTDWLKTVRGQSSVVLRPNSTDEVSAILKYCNERYLAVCPQGGNTGLVGGSVPVFDEIIISMGRMNKIIDVDQMAGVLTCEAGCILESLDAELSSHGLMMPLDLGAKGSCHIGGNISTNAGGIRLLRYGSLHGNVLGVQVVLANGDVLDNLNPLIKDNTGYDLKHLFIGAEGTLGVVTAATIKCPPKPNAVNAALLGVDSFAKCLEILPITKRFVGEILSAYELIDAASRDVVTDNLNLKYPLSGDYPFYLLIETSGADENHDMEKLDKLLQHLMEHDIVIDGTTARDQSQLQYMWSLRERIAEALLADGYCYKYDISLPLKDWYQIVEDFRLRLQGSAAIRCTGYGHLGDGNLHLNMTSKEYDQSVMDLIEPYVYNWTAERNGSISAEHGLGFKKRNYIYHSKNHQMVGLMKTMKATLDPKGILNPYKYLPDN